MTLLRTYHPAFSMPNLVNKFFNMDPAEFFGNDNLNFSLPAINVSETDDAYRIELAAPGLTKKDFKVNLDNDLLTIEATNENEKVDKTDNYVRKEFDFTSFKRSFTIPEDVDAEKLNAVYENGILNLTLPKKEEAKVKPAREIKIK